MSLPHDPYPRRSMFLSAFPSWIHFLVHPSLRKPFLPPLYRYPSPYPFVCLPPSLPIYQATLPLQGTADHTVPSAHVPRIKALIEGCATSGDNATLTSASTKSTQRKPRPAVSVSLVPGTGHVLTWTHAEEVEREVCQFLKGRARATWIVPGLRLRRPHIRIALRAGRLRPQRRYARGPGARLVAHHDASSRRERFCAHRAAYQARRLAALVQAAAGPPDGACG
ncbi:hypothetical protein C8R44DRAFT_194824 [Mycena epipterygia]|nr:hypothetical protein C8R44DRAFT_194824 [Mycena epipterygia]